MTPPKEQNNFPVTGPKEVNIYKLPKEKLQNNCFKEVQQLAKEHR